MARLCEFPGLAPLSRFGTGACRAQWALKASGASGNGKERLRDYSVSRVGSPKIPEKTQSQSRLHSSLRLRRVLFVKQEFRRE